jgi:hypothetical protein
VLSKSGFIKKSAGICSVVEQCLKIRKLYEKNRPKIV